MYPPPFICLCQSSLSLKASVVDMRAWRQLRGLRERQLYLLKLLGQAERDGGPRA